MSHAPSTRITLAVRLDIEELLNTLTHGIGAVLSVAGAVVLLVCAQADGDIWRMAGFGIYAFSLVGVYAFSTLSHAVTDPQPRRMLRVLDQAFIYLLIAGSYTPFALTYLRSPGWLAFLVLIWALAFFGFLSKVLMAHRVDSVALWLYVILGWLPGLAVKPLVNTVPSPGLMWMLVGGICYTAGTFFLANDQRKPFYHAVWHVFVIAGSAWHFLAILTFVGMAS